jgi:G3E family GTPase
MMTDAANDVGDGRAKVAVLVGFLGAGKTTLLRHLVMSEEDMTGTVVIVNEFGEVGFDGSLIKRLDSDVIELVSGCVCCTLVVGLTLTLQRILDELKPRRILIEASGLADPRGIVKILEGDGIRERINLHRMITILDARCWAIRESFGHLFFNQLESAGFLILNKIDQIDRAKLPTFLGEIREALPRASVIPAIQCRIDPESVWGGDAIGDSSEQALTAAYLSAGDNAHGHSHDHVHADEAGYAAFAFEDERPLDEDQFRELLDGLPFEVFRVKGTVRFPDRTDVINLVGGNGEWTRWQGEPATRLTFVGWDVEGDTILERLEACVAAG